MKKWYLLLITIVILATLSVSINASSDREQPIEENRLISSTDMIFRFKEEIINRIPSDEPEEQPDEDECTDTDVTPQHPDGKNFYLKGGIIGSLVSPNNPGEDVCYSDGYIRELFCNEDSCGEPMLYACPNGCSDGACIAAGPFCFDSDDGRDYYTIGTTEGTVAGSEYPRVTATTDKCADYIRLYEYSCFYTENVVDGTPGYYFGSEVYTCPLGCSEGVCREINTNRIMPIR